MQNNGGITRESGESRGESGSGLESLGTLDAIWLVCMNPNKAEKAHKY